ncbi:MAG TPA: polyhydroxyalkanoic acid system family protein [Polyangiaceae bacterium]
MKHAVVHDLGQDLAKKVADAAFASYAKKFEKYQPKSNWVSPNRANISFSVKGMTLSGALEVTATTIEMDLDVPFLLKPFKGTAISVIEGEIRAWIKKAKAGEIQ